MNRELCQQLIHARRNHAAWLLLASRNGPLTLACLHSLFQQGEAAVTLEDATERLAEAYTHYTNDSEFDTGGESDQLVAARRELRQWIRRGLIVERDGQLLATDALQRAMLFVDSLQERTMTSTASRLATVQREIESLSTALSPDQTARERLLQQRIDALEAQLEAVKGGDFEVLDGPQALEGIREVHQLATSLQADFRSVEDSYRAADLALRQRIIGEKHHRGEIVDDLLAGHEALVQTVEGQVFESFHQQLAREVELSKMKQQLREILHNPVTDSALNRKQKTDLSLLVPRLVGESERVIQARARSERDVRGFLTSGLADEQLRVGAALSEIFHVALEVDWQSQAVRRTPAPLRPIAIVCNNLPLAERFLVKDLTQSQVTELDFNAAHSEVEALDEEFWQAYDALDRVQLFEQTLAYLKETGQPVTLGSLAQALPPTHDLETLAFWLAMAREAGVETDDSTESIELYEEGDGWTRFHAPKLQFAFNDVAQLSAGELD